MKQTKRKGFTIVELVIVIAVIAILAAVLIPTFASLINKANRSADIQAVHQMNTQLAIDEVDSNKTIVDVYAALEEGGMTAKDYHPLASNTYFFWVEALNRIVYTDKEYKVTFPEEYEGKSVSDKEVAGDKAYLSLSGEIEETEVKVENGTATVSTAEELYWLSENAPADLTEITFDTESINLMGANISFSVGDGTSEKSLTITGKDGGTTLKGLVQLTNKLDGADSDQGKKYASGFVANVNNKATLSISNIVIDCATVGDYDIGTLGILVGRVGNSATVSVSGCTVKNSTVYGANKVAPLIGSIAGSTVTVTGCKVESCTVNCTEGEAGKVIGCVYNGACVTIDKDFDSWVNDVTLNLVKDYHNREIIDYTEGDCQKLVQKYDYKNATLENEYRMFADDAYMTILKNKPYNATEGMYVKVNNADKYTLEAKDVYVDPTTKKEFKDISDTYAGIGLVFVK